MILFPADLHERYSLGVARLEPDRGTGCNVEAETICSPSVELELRICLDEVVV